MTTHQAYTTIGHKSLFDRIYILCVGILFLVCLNIMIYGRFDPILLIVAIITGYILYAKITRYKNLLFEFSPTQITIKQGTKKSYTLPRKQIQSIQEIKTKNQWSHMIHKFARQHKTAYYLTSTQKMLRITMNDDTRIYLSPKTIKNWVYKEYNIKRK